MKLKLKVIIHALKMLLPRLEMCETSAESKAETTAHVLTHNIKHTYCTCVCVCNSKNTKTRKMYCITN